MRMLLYIALFLLGGGAVALFLRKDSGYALLSYDVWTIEMSLAMLVLIGALIFGLLYMLLRLVLRSLQLPRNVHKWQTKHHAHLARKTMTQGLLELAEGNWAAAEQQLIKQVDDSETPLLNYLSAARAAQLQNAHVRQEQYIRLAHQKMPSADIAVSLTQAELQLASRQWEQALATLQELHERAPRHTYVLKLLAQVYEKLGDWEQLNRILPNLKKAKVHNITALDELEINIKLALLKAAGKSSDPTKLDEVFAQLSKPLKHNQQIIIAYAHLLLQRGEEAQVEALISQALKQDWNEKLVALYGQLAGEKPTQQLTLAEHLLEQHPQNSVLLLTLGRLSLRAKLWGKARNYLETSININGSIEASRELGHLLEVMGEPTEALNVYRQGVMGTAGPAPVTLPKNVGRLTNQPPLEDPRIVVPPPHGGREP